VEPPNYEISDEDRVKADIVRAVLARSVQIQIGVETFSDLGITLILSENQ